MGASRAPIKWSWGLTCPSEAGARLCTEEDCCPVLVLRGFQNGHGLATRGKLTATLLLFVHHTSELTLAPPWASSPLLSSRRCLIDCPDIPKRALSRPTELPLRVKGWESRMGYFELFSTGRTYAVAVKLREKHGLDGMEVQSAHKACSE